MGTLSAILTVLGILCLGGIPLLFVTFLALMGLTPLYVAQVIPIVGIALLLAIGLHPTRRLSSKAVKRMWLGLLTLCLLWSAFRFSIWRSSSIWPKPNADRWPLLFKSASPLPMMKSPV